MAATATAGSAAAAAEALRAHVAGEVIAAGDPAYDESRRVWNGMIDRRPAVIVSCTGVADVLAAVRHAREHDLAVTVRCGGHNVAGTAVADGALVIDLGGMRGVVVDPDERTALVGGGARLGDVDRETQAFGLAAPFGVFSRTGVGGLTLNGGMGFLSRRLGLSCDNLVAADMVTADGRLVHASADEDAELLWALRGGGGDLGVVTSFKFRLHPVGPDVWMAMTIYPADAAAEMTAALSEHMAGAPDELTTLGIHWSAPHEEPVAPEWQGRDVFVVAACWSGPVEEGEEAIRPLRELATPVADLSARMPFVDAQRLFDPEYPDGRRYYWTSIYLDDLGGRVNEVLGRYAASRPSPLSSIDVWMALGGALRREPEGGAAFAKRDARYMVGIEANWDDPADDAANLAWARDLFAELYDISPGGSYLNFPGFAEEGEELLRRSLDGSYDRLKALKARFDPEGLFQNRLGR